LKNTATLKPGVSCRRRSLEMEITPHDFIFTFYSKLGTSL